MLELALGYGEDDASNRADNITDSILRDYRASLDEGITKDDIFYYVYGILHSPEYRKLYAADLKKLLPRIPRVAVRDDFYAFSASRQELADLHLGYETVEPFPARTGGHRLTPI